MVPLPKVEYVPTEHFPLPLDEVHPSKQNLPAGHAMQALADEEPFKGWKVPAGHSKHAFSEKEPFWGLNVPGGQRLQARDVELSKAYDPSSQCILMIPE